MVPLLTLSSYFVCSYFTLATATVTAVCPDGHSCPSHGQTLLQASKQKVSLVAAPSNYYRKERLGVGGYGGTCTCPDGQEYEVGDHHNHCGSLACEGGTWTDCESVDMPKRQGMKVTCAPALYSHKGCLRMIDLCAGDSPKQPWYDANWTAWRVGFGVACANFYEGPFCDALEPVIFNFDSSVVGLRGGDLVKNAPEPFLSRFCQAGGDLSLAHDDHVKTPTSLIGFGTNLLQTLSSTGSILRTLRSTGVRGQILQHSADARASTVRRKIQKCQDDRECWSQVSSVQGIFSQLDTHEKGEPLRPVCDHIKYPACAKQKVTANDSNCQSLLNACTSVCATGKYALPNVPSNETSAAQDRKGSKCCFWASSSGQKDKVCTPSKATGRALKMVVSMAIVYLGFQSYGC